MLGWFWGFGKYINQLKHTSCQCCNTLDLCCILIVFWCLFCTKCTATDTIIHYYYGNLGKWQWYLMNYNIISESILLLHITNNPFNHVQECTQYVVYILLRKPIWTKTFFSHYLFWTMLNLAKMFTLHFMPGPMNNIFVWFILTYAIYIWGKPCKRIPMFVYIICMKYLFIFVP